jgi:hypothetical protein
MKIGVFLELVSDALIENAIVSGDLRKIDDPFSSLALLSPAKGSALQTVRDRRMEINF